MRGDYLYGYKVVTFVNCLQVEKCCERRLFIWLQSGDVTSASANKVNTSTSVQYQTLSIKESTRHQCEHTLMFLHCNTLQCLQNLQNFFLCKHSPLCDTYLAVLQSVPPSLGQQWEFHFLGLEMMVLRAGLKRVELHVQRRSKQH